MTTCFAVDELDGAREMASEVWLDPQRSVARRIGQVFHAIAWRTR